MHLTQCQAAYYDWGGKLKPALHAGNPIPEERREAGNPFREPNLADATACFDEEVQALK